MKVLSQSFKAISWKSLNFGVVNAISFCQIVMTSITVALILSFAGLPGLDLSFSFFLKYLRHLPGLGLSSSFLLKYLLHLPGPGFLHYLGCLVLNQCLAEMSTRRNSRCFRRNSG